MSLLSGWAEPVEDVPSGELRHGTRAVCDATTVVGSSPSSP